MQRIALAYLAAGLVAVWPANESRAEPPLCDVGASVVELAHLQSTGGGPGIDLTVVGASLIFLRECPASVIPAFSEAADAGFDPMLQRKWIKAVRSAVLDSSNAVVRSLLISAHERVVQLDDRSLDEFLDGIFGVLRESQGIEPDSLETVLERQAAATLRQHAECDGAGCFNTSDNVLFLLGTHPLAMLKAMSADSAAAEGWLHVVADQSFVRAPEKRGVRESARRAVVSKLSETEAPGLERQRRACEETFRRIRFRAWR